MDTKWIKLEDSLPKKNQRVLVYLEQCGYEDSIDLCTYTGSDDIYFFDRDTYGYSEIEVTHWMPLPETPKK